MLAWEALAFLVVASTLVGYAVFLTLNAKVSPTLANTFNYAAPVIAQCLSALLLHEPLTIVKLLAGAITLAGVALMIDRKAPDAHHSASAHQGERSVRAPHVQAPSESDRSIRP